MRDGKRRHMDKDDRLAIEEGVCNGTRVYRRREIARQAYTPTLKGGSPQGYNVVDGKARWVAGPRRLT